MENSENEINTSSKKKIPPRKPRNKDSSNVNTNAQAQNESNLPIIKNITDELDGFILNCQGMIQNAQFFDGDAIYCRYDIVTGPDWKLLEGKTNGESQFACQSEGSNNYFVWNFPFEFAYKATNCSGWPQVVVSCFYPDFFGRVILKAYGVCYLPTNPGLHIRTLQMFSPVCSSVLVEFVGIFLGANAEIRNPPKVLSTGEGRENIRVKSEGSLKIKFNINLTNIKKFGYNI